MNFILNDEHPVAFYPLTLTRPVSGLRAGMMTIKEKWQLLLKTESIGDRCEPYLSKKFPHKLASDNVLIDSRLIPNKELAKACQRLLNNEALVSNNKCLAIRVDGNALKNEDAPLALEDFIDSNTKVSQFTGKVIQLQKLTDLFLSNHEYIRLDYDLLTKEKKSEKLNKTNTVIGDELFVAGKVKANCSVFNTETGPIYIDEGAEVMEGCMLRGPLYIGKGAVIKMGAKIYGATTIGPECRVGGEVSNSVMTGYSNKGHDGFMGNSILGEWCNLGADTNTSNLKNNYSEVKIWNFEKGDYTGSGLQFCGLLMGDHSKAAINTQFNTGTTVGVMANVFASGFPAKYIPSFSWLGDENNASFKIDKALQLAKDVMSRRHVDFTKADAEILTHLSKNS